VDVVRSDIKAGNESIVTDVLAIGRMPEHFVPCSIPKSLTKPC
jgi:hypothetical protein